MAKWLQIVDAVADNVRGHGYRTPFIEGIARLVPLAHPSRADRFGLSERQWEYHAATGAALERVLCERYRAEWASLPDSEVFELGHGHPADEYRDRVDRARSDTAYRILEERHPGELFDAFPYADSLDAAPDGAWREHVRTFYGIAP